MRMYRQTSYYGWYVNPDLINQITDDEGNEVIIFIPRGHRFWVEYEAWLAAGNVPLPPNDMGTYPPPGS